MNKVFLSLAVIVLIFIGFEAYNYLMYPAVKVTSYELLMKKAKYGKITHAEIRIGAFELIESHLCQLITEEITAECLKKFEEKKEDCAAKIIDPVDVSNFNENDTYMLVRQFNVCRN